MNNFYYVYYLMDNKKNSPYLIDIVDNVKVKFGVRLCHPFKRKK